MSDSLTVMIVDDNRTNLALMDMLIRKLPHCSTLLYTDSAEAAESLANATFDIAIVDFQMPTINGVELTAVSAASSVMPRSPS